jgi:hypothetical protein
MVQSPNDLPIEIEGVGDKDYEKGFIFLYN